MQPLVEVADADAGGHGEEGPLALPDHAHDLDVVRPREVPGEVEDGSDRVGFEWLNFLGHYNFSLPEAVREGNFRPLRTPGQR